MCDPVTLSAAAMAVTASATAFAGYTAYQGAKVSEAAATINQGYEQKAADDAVARGEKDAQAHYRQLSALKGRQRAEFGAAGIDLSTGSPLDTLTDTSIFGNEDANTIRQNAMREADGHRISAANYEMDANMARYQQSTIPISTALSVGSTLLTGYGKTRELMNTTPSASFRTTTTKAAPSSGMNRRGFYGYGG